MSLISSCASSSSNSLFETISKEVMASRRQFVNEIRALCPKDGKYDLLAIDKKVQELINIPEFQFPEIAGRLHDLRVSVSRLTKILPNPIDKLDEEGIFNKINTIAKLALGESIVKTLPIDIIFFLPKANDPNNLEKLLRKNSSYASIHFQHPVDPDQRMPLASLIKNNALSLMSPAQAFEFFDLFFRAGFSANDTMPYQKNLTLSLLSQLIVVFHWAKKNELSLDPSFANFIEILDLYIEYGGNVNLQPSKKLEVFLPTSFILSASVKHKKETLTILRYLIECAGLDVNMTYKHSNGVESTMLNAAVSSDNPNFEFIETLIYYGAKFSANTTIASNAASADTNKLIPITCSEELQHIIKRAQALREAVIARYDIPEMSSTIQLGISELNALINGYYLKDVQIARDCIAQKAEFNKEYDARFPFKSTIEASSAATASAATPSATFASD